jgi:hypothetical protein
LELKHTKRPDTAEPPAARTIALHPLFLTRDRRDARRDRLPVAIETETLRTLENRTLTTPEKSFQCFQRLQRRSLQRVQRSRSMSEGFKGSELSNGDTSNFNNSDLLIRC